MRIAGAILAIFPLSIIILVQSLAAGTADAIDNSGGSGGTFGFFVAIAFIVGAALMFGKVMKGALGVFIAAAALAWIGAASSIFSDLWVWGFVAALYAGCIYWGVRRAGKAATASLSPAISPETVTMATAEARFDTQTGMPLAPEARFDSQTGQPLHQPQS